MGKTVKKCLLILVGVLVLLLAGLGVWAALNWDSVQILAGTGDLGDTPQQIPEPTVPATSLSERGHADWPCWRNRDGQAKSAVTGIIKDWSAGLKQLWEVNYLCQGEDSATWSAPVVQGDRLVVPGRDTNDDLLFCLNVIDGSLLWYGRYPAKGANTHGTGMRATPAIDDGRVFTFGRSGDLVCWNLEDGAIMWHKNVDDEGGKEPRWGHASSPLISGDQVIVQGGGAALIIAYNKSTGDVAWKSGPGKAGYAPVVPITMGDTAAHLVYHADGLAAIEAGKGKSLWDTPWGNLHGVNATTPLVDGDRVFITSGYGKGAKLLKVSSTGCDVLWTTRAMASHHSDGYILDGDLYGYTGQSMQNKGDFVCLDLSDGTVKWSANDMGWGTCTYVDAHLLCVDIKGNLFLMKPDPEKFIKVTSLPTALGDVEGPVWTLPVIANDRLFLRFKQRLVCYAITNRTPSENETKQ